ncbi:MAG TPA: site-specific integrase [Actinomycetota bacterium]|nr:site-specific integrase [Actinomycetota bacterium]
MQRPAGAALVLVDGVHQLHPEAALFESMLEGWRRQQESRRLGTSIIFGRDRLVRRFQAYSAAWPWAWRPQQLEAWVSSGGWAHSTIRSYQGALGMFLAYLLDARYGWAAICEQEVGAIPVQICHEWNTAAHVVDYEARPQRRPLSRIELQAFFDLADRRALAVAASGRKGALAAFRDAALFKVVYGWGLRRREAAMLDVGDFSSNPAAPELGRFGVCHVRYAKASRGSPPKRRAVATVMPWAAEVLAQYLAEVRPRYPEHAGACLWPTERGGRISPRHLDDRFAAYRVAAGLPAELSVHCLRHSFVSHQIEDGVDPVFVQQQVGHSYASTTAVYTTVGADYKNKMLRAALSRAFDPHLAESGP